MPPTPEPRPVAVYYVVQWTGRRHKRLAGPYLWAEAAEQALEQRTPAPATHLTVEPASAFDLDTQRVRDPLSQLKRITALAEDTDFFYGETTAPGVGCVHVRLAKAPVVFDALPVWEEWARISISQRSILARLAADHAPQTPDSLALDVKLSAPTVRKALRTLAELGFVVDTGAGRYAPASPRTLPEPVVSPPPETVELPAIAPAPPPSAPVDWVQTSFA